MAPHKHVTVADSSNAHLHERTAPRSDGCCNLRNAKEGMGGKAGQLSCLARPQLPFILPTLHGIAIRAVNIATQHHSKGNNYQAQGTRLHALRLTWLISHASWSLMVGCCWRCHRRLLGLQLHERHSTRNNSL